METYKLNNHAHQHNNNNNKYRYTKCVSDNLFINLFQNRQRLNNTKKRYFVFNFPNGKLSPLIIFEKFVSRNTGQNFKRARIGSAVHGMEATYRSQAHSLLLYSLDRVIISLSHTHTHIIHRIHTHNVSEVYTERTVHDLLLGPKTCAQSGHAMSIYCSLFK